MGSTEKTLQRVLAIAQRLFEAERDRPVAPSRTPAEMEERIDFSIGKQGLPLEEVLSLVERIVLETPRTGSRRFFNQLFAGRDEVAAAAEMLTALLNSSMYTYKVAGPHALIESVLTDRLALKVGYSEGEGEGVFVPGGSMANLAALIIARNEAEPEARNGGMSGARVTVYASEDCHYSVPKGAGMAGIGRENVRMVRCDERGRLDPAALREAIGADVEAGATPIMICATAGTTVLGAYDPIEPIADIAEDFGVWLHVDGAMGGSALLTERHRHLLRGSERSDSFAWDAHKLMGTPLSCSVILCKQRGTLAKHFEEGASYLFQSDEDRYDHGKRSMQCGRRNDALKLWAAWKRRGDEGYAARIEHLFEIARYTADRVRAHPDLVLTREPESITACFEFVGKSSEEICERLRRESRAVVGYADVTGRRVIRVACANEATTREDIDGFLADVLEVARGVEAGESEVVGTKPC